MQKKKKKKKKKHKKTFVVICFGSRVKIASLTGLRHRNNDKKEREGVQANFGFH